MAAQASCNGVLPCGSITFGEHCAVSSFNHISTGQVDIVAGDYVRIGPNVTIGEKTVVENSIINNSIIGSFSKLDTAVLNNSVIGSDSVLKGLNQSLNIGDNAEIDFS